MLMPWSTIFIALMPSSSILVHSRALPMNYEENQQWTDNMADNSSSDTCREKLFRSSPETNATGPSIETRKFSVYLDRQETTGRKLHRHDIGVSFEKKNDQNKSYVLANLLKVASDRIAKKDSVSSAQRLKKFKLPYAVRRKFTSLQNNNNSTENIVKHTTVTSLNTSSQLSSNYASNNRSKQQSICCQVIQDIYITDINEKVPSYACKLENNTFFLSSKKFSQDRRNSLDVSIDEDTLRRLNNDSLTSIPPIIEIVLALKSDGKNYEIHNRRAEL